MRGPAAAASWAVEVSGLTKAYDHRPVLRGVDLRVAVGQTLAILGANGSGKTTLLRVIATLSSPTRGTVRVFGQPADASAALRRRLGFVAHDSLLYDNLTVGENLAFFAGLYALDGSRVAAILRQAALEPLAHRRTRILSRGQRQQVNLARALLHNPEILLLDEPYTGLDVTAAGRLTTMLRDETRQGRTVIFTTHDLAEADALGADLAVLLSGRLTEVLPPGALDADRLSRWLHEGQA